MFYYKYHSWFLFIIIFTMWFSLTSRLCQFVDYLFGTRSWNFPDWSKCFITSQKQSPASVVSYHGRMYALTQIVRTISRELWTKMSINLYYGSHGRNYCGELIFFMTDYWETRMITPKPISMWYFFCVFSVVLFLHWNNYSCWKVWE